MACLLVFPPYQRKGFGKFLIDFSYKMSEIEGKIGTPERPLSEFGLVSFRNYWTTTIINVIKSNYFRYFTIEDLSILTGICKFDIIYTLRYHGMLKFSKDRHMIDIETLGKKIKNIKTKY